MRGKGTYPTPRQKSWRRHWLTRTLPALCDATYSLDSMIFMCASSFVLPFIKLFNRLVRQQDAYLAIRPAMTNKCISRTDTNPPFAFQTAFPRGTDFSVSTGRVKKLHTLLVSLYF